MTDIPADHVRVVQLCAHVRPDGTRCEFGVDLNPRNGLCVHHDPERVDKLVSMRQRAGRATRRRSKVGTIRTVDPGDTPPPLATLEDCVTWSAWVAVAVAEGKIDSRTASVINASIREFRSSYAQSNLSKRMRDLERATAKLRGGDA